MTLDKLVHKYSKFVEKYSKNISENEKFKDMPYDDIMQCAYIGLIRAYDKNEYETGDYTEDQFKNYARFYMYDEIQRGYHEFKNAVHFPENYISEMKKIKALLDEDDDIEKLAKKMNYSVDRIKEALYISYMFDNLFSYKDEFGNDLNVPMFVRDVKYDGDYNFDDNKIETKVFSKHIMDEIFKGDMLTKREKEVLYLRFGFDGKPKTQDEIAKMYNLTRARIYRIEGRIFLKLRRYLLKKGYRCDLFD